MRMKLAFCKQWEQMNNVNDFYFPQYFFQVQCFCHVQILLYYVYPAVMVFLGYTILQILHLVSCLCICINIFHNITGATLVHKKQCSA